MSWQYSSVAHDEVWVEDDDTMVWCDECDAEFDASEQGDMSEGVPLCDQCYDSEFGG